MNERKPSLWKQGKEQYKEFMKINFKKWTNFKIIFFGMVITAIIILPFAMLLMNFWSLYQYNIQVYYFVMTIVFVLLMVCNGLSNFYSIRLSKLYNSERTNLQEIDEWSILFYQLLNPGFAVFIFIILLLFRLFTI